jgi:hypothetical protein
MRYATLSLALVLCLLLTGCVNAGAGLSPETQEQIPDGANVIRLTSDRAPSEYYDALYQELARKGYEITQSDEEQNTLSTAPKTSGQETTLALRLFIDERDSEGGSLALLRGRWGVSGSMAAGMGAAFGAGMDKNMGEPAVWKQNHRAGVAFGQLVKTAQDLPHQQISYEVE